MKKIITCSAIVALLLTSVQADFDFGDVFKDMKVAQESNFVFGDVFRDVKVVQESNFDFGDVFKDMKNPVQ